MIKSEFCEQLEDILAPYLYHFSSDLSADKEYEKPEVGASNSPEGGCQVVINYRRSDSKGCILLGKEWMISPADELLHRLRHEYGHDTVELEYIKTTTLL